MPAPTEALEKIARLEKQLERLQSLLDSENMTRIQAEIALGSAEEQLALALDAARLATWQWNLHQRRIRFNPRWGEMTQGIGLSTDVSDAQWMAGIHPDDRAQLQDTLTQVAKRKRTRFLAQFRYQAHATQGSQWLWIEMVGVLQSTDSTSQGAEKIIIGCASDITVRKNHLDELKAARAKAEQASLSKTEFLAQVSHELRTPLHGVLGMAELLRSPGDAPLSAVQSEQLAVLKQSADHVLALVNDLLDFSSFEREHSQGHAAPFQSVYETTELHAWVHGICAPFKHRAAGLGLGLNVAIQIDTPCHLQLELRRTTQVLNNLLSNAFKFTPRGEISLRFHGNDTHLTIEVQDSGIGIAPEKLQDIFKAFTQADSGIQRQYGGSGLGLSISQSICNHLGGQITVVSTPNQGSTFTVTLPVVWTSAVPAATPSSASLPALDSALRVLLVDDTPVNLRLARAYLQQSELDAALCESGAQGLTMMETQDFDVAVVDLQMPVMSGFEMMHAGRAKQPGCQWIAATAHAVNGYEAQCKAAGFDGFLAKPFTADQLYQAILNTQKPSVNHDRQPPQTQMPSASITPLSQGQTSNEQAILPEFHAQTFIKRFGFDPQLMQQIEAALNEDAPKRVAILRGALASKDNSEIRRQAHALKGAFGQLGDVHIPRLCLALETNAEQCTPQAIDALETAIKTVIQIIADANLTVQTEK